MQGATTAAELQPTEAIIDRIVTRYHKVHRAELPELAALAAKVENVHADHPAVPRGLADVLERMLAELEDHMRKEEMILFPVMLEGGMPGIGGPIFVMRADHDEHEETIARIRKITGGLTPPDDACGSWRRLYAGTEKLLSDLAEHIHLENDVLFPRFENAR
ncbi:hemerythrin domain-containing protein [Ostreiculturibacter nitratireducens]|uniref:hemerythrin domain-containing protein n=1 Tax=Ostreiculturibacter nitratireducens TaxID=3075226 RepID=UPI0031B59A9F